MKVSKGCIKPLFVCVGVQKGGTTSLQEMLMQNSRIYLPPEKELQFFTYNYNRGNDWYASHFENASRDQLVGEITPYYMYHPYAVMRMRKVLGKIKIIVLLRDPVQRTISQYWHSIYHGYENEDFERAIMLEKTRLAGASIRLRRGERVVSHQENSYIGRSQYRDQIKRLWRYFGRQRVLIIQSEYMFEFPERTLRSIYKFLEVEVKGEVIVRKSNQNKIYEPGKIGKAEIESLRKILDDSYVFCREELGWGYRDGWDW